jgi:hypothetical protein
MKQDDTDELTGEERMHVEAAVFEQGVLEMLSSEFGEERTREDFRDKKWGVQRLREELSEEKFEEVVGEDGDITGEDTIISAQATTQTTEWREEIGPRGAQRWVNSQGDIRYREPKGGREADDDSGSDGGGEESSIDDSTFEVPDTGTHQREDGYYVSARPDRERDIESFMQSDQADERIELANSGPGEGFSFQRNLDTYDATDDNAWLVGMTDVKVPADEGVSKEDVTSFYNEFIEVLQETPALRVGGYHFEDGERISIDLTVALTDIEEADELGRELNQESIFNPYLALGQGKWDEGSVKTGGTGESPVETPEDVRQVLSDVDSLAKRFSDRIAALAGRVMKQDERVDPDREFEGQDTGRIRDRMNIFRYGWREGADIEDVEDRDAYIVEGELYEPVD